MQAGRTLKPLPQSFTGDSRRVRALISRDTEELSRILADDYWQYDDSGRAFTKQDVLQNLQAIFCVSFAAPILL